MNINYSKLIFRKVASLVLIICLIFGGCATANFDKVEKLQASSYKYSCSKSGLIISVDPFIEKDRVNRFFGYDLLSKGILPVLVVFENKTAEDGYILLNERAMLLMKNKAKQTLKNNNGGNIQSVEEMEHSADVQAGFTLASAASLPAGSMATAAGAASLTAGAALGVAGLIVLLIPAGIAAKHQENLLRIQQNMTDNELTNNRPLYNGSSNNGFLYLKIEKEEDIKNIDGFMFYFKNMRTGEIQSMALEIK